MKYHFIILVKSLLYNGLMTLSSDTLQINLHTWRGHKTYSKSEEEEGQEDSPAPRLEHCNLHLGLAPTQYFECPDGSWFLLNYFQVGREHIQNIKL